MKLFEQIENYKTVNLSESNRDIIEQALHAYKNISIYQSKSDEYLEIQSLEIDEILENIKD